MKNLFIKITLLILYWWLLPFQLHSNPITPEERAKGAIIGAAYGDALGRITEFIPSTEDIQEKFGPKGATSLKQAVITHPITKQKVAPYTDDTVMAKIVLKSALNARNRSLMHTIDTEFAKLYSPQKYTVDPLFDLRAHGITAQNIYRDAKKYQPNTFEKIAAEGGCGSVMRAWPLGLVYAHNTKKAVALADAQSSLTHRHPMARAASAALAIGIAEAYKGSSVDATIQAMIKTAEAYDTEELRYKIDARKLNGNFSLNSQLIAQDKLLTSDMIKYAYQAACLGKQPETILGTHNKKSLNRRSGEGFLLGWSADEAPAAAVYVFVRHANNLKTGIIEGANTPGDSDSIASIAGALIGTHTGLKDQLTHADYELLENKDELLKLAEQTAKKQTQ